MDPPVQRLSMDNLSKFESFLDRMRQAEEDRSVAGDTEPGRGQPEPKREERPTYTRQLSRGQIGAHRQQAPSSQRQDRVQGSERSYQTDRTRNEAGRQPR